MELVKLNRRYKAFKENGHHWAFRWDSYDAKTCRQVEHIFQDMYGSQYNYSTTNWKANFGHAPNSNSSRPYWVSFTNEHDATAVLLRMDKL
jgi:hypothetical protein